MSGEILIADGQPDRARRIAQTCETRGLLTRCAPHGPAALESSLADPPDLIIASEDLPMISADRLVEILRSNPRTQGIPFLFLGAGIKSGDQSPLDEDLPAGEDPEEIARRAEWMIDRRCRMDAVVREAGAEHEIAGKLAQISLPDLLQLFHLNRRTGTVELARRRPGGMEQRGRIFLRDGDVIQAEAGTVEGEKALYRLLHWREGTFAFSATRVQAPARITIPTRALLLEGMRHLDEWERARGGLPSLEATATLKVKRAELPNVVQPLTQEVLLLLEIYCRVADIVDHCSYPDYQVLRTLQALGERGIVELLQERPPDPRGDGSGLFSAAQARRLQEWLRSRQPEGATYRVAKLVLVPGSEAATREFVELLTRLPGVHPTRDAAELGTVGAHDFVSLVHLEVDESSGIEILHVPADPFHQPLWGLAAHGALGVFVLLDGTGPAARALLEGPARSLGSVPGTRLFHVVLARDQDPGDPQELREALALPERASLWVLDPEGTDPRDALRTLLAEVIS